VTSLFSPHQSSPHIHRGYETDAAKGAPTEAGAAGGELRRERASRRAKDSALASGRRSFEGVAGGRCFHSTFYLVETSAGWRNFFEKNAADSNASAGLAAAFRAGQNKCLPPRGETD
jgi:hypothetical protein